MIKSRCWHTPFCYGDGKDIIMINSFTRNLKYQRTMMKLGSGNLEIGVNLSYNSNYKSGDFGSLRIGMDNGWKFSCEQYLFPYNTQYEMYDFDNGDYVYIDGNWDIHRFVRYGRKMINNINVDLYYEYNNDNVRMHVQEDGIIKIIDDHNNTMYFDSYGRLYQLTSGINSNINKKINYFNNRIGNIYDQRQPTKSINFTYENDLIKNITNSCDSRKMTFEYTNDGKIYRLLESINSTEKKLVEYRYSDVELVNEIINLESLNTILIDYEYDITENRYNTAILRETGYNKIIDRDKVNDDLFSNDNIYLNNNIFLRKKRYIFNGEHYELDLNNIKKHIIFTNQNGSLLVFDSRKKQIKYCFDYEGKITASLEAEDNYNHWSLFKVNGCLLSENNNNDVKINGNSSITLQNQLFSVNKVENINFKKFTEDIHKNYPNSKNPFLEDFNISFWLWISHSVSYQTYVRVVFYYETDSVSFRHKLATSNGNSWQFVSIPIILERGIDGLIGMDISFYSLPEEYSLKIADVKMGVGQTNRTYINQTNLDDIDQLLFTEDGELKLEDINSFFYFTQQDIVNTYKSLFKNKLNNSNTFDMIYCDGKKVKLVNNIELFHDKSIVSEIGNSLYEPDYRIQLSYKTCANKYDIIEKKHSYIKDQNTNRIIFTTLTSYDKVNLRTDNAYYARAKQAYTKSTIEGLIVKEKDFSDNVIEYEYDEYGNIQLIRTRNTQDDSNEQFCILYTYDQTFTSLRTLPVQISEMGDEIQYEYDLDYGNVLSVTQKNIKTSYTYDEFKENVIAIKFTDRNTNEEIDSHHILYNNCLLSKLKNNSDCYTKYFYNSDKDLMKCFSNKIHMLEIEEEKKPTSTLYKKIRKQYNTVTNNIEDLTVEFEYDLYDRLKKITEGNNITEIAYQDEINPYEENVNEEENIRYFSHLKNHKESKYCQKPVVIFDPYTKINTVYYYDENDNVIGFDEREKDINSNGLRIEKYRQSDTKIRYKLYEYDPDSNDFVFFLNVNYDDENSLIKTSSKRILRTWYTYINDDEEKIVDSELDCNYEYDLFGRVVRKKSSKKYSANIDRENIVEKKYINGTNKLLQNKFSINYMGTYNVQLASCSLTENIEYDIINSSNNISKITDEGSLFSDSICESNKYNVSKIRTFEYDKCNRISKETNSELGTYEYSYDSNGNIVSVKKDANTIKQLIYDGTKISSAIINGINYNIEYDLRGNIIKFGNYIFTYNHLNLIETFKDTSQDDGNLVRYYYNNKGILFRKTKTINVQQNETIVYDIRYYLDCNKILAESYIDSNNNENYFSYYYDLEGICSIKYKNEIYTLVKDSLGNISKIIIDGKLLAEYEYDAWGNHRIIYYQPETALTQDQLFVVEHNPFRYKGYYYDVETQLFYCNSRYYSPELCRWISPDSIEYLDPSSINGLNLYCYCMNDPVNLYDPSGHAAISLLSGLIIGGLVSWGLSELFGEHLVTGTGLAITGGSAVVSGIMAMTLATPVGWIVGGITAVAGIFTLAFASAELQQHFTGDNWMLDGGMNEGVYYTLMTISSITASVGTAASSVAYHYKINAVTQKGRINGKMVSGTDVEGYPGLRFSSKTGKVYSLEFHPNHNGHGVHIQWNQWFTTYPKFPGEYILNPLWRLRLW